MKSLAYKGKRFLSKDLRILTEIYRRLNYFHNGNLKTQLLLPALPSEVKNLKNLGILKSTNKEQGRVMNWYMLGEKGKNLFQHFIEETRLSEEENLAYFNGKIKDGFDPRLMG